MSAPSRYKMAFLVWLAIYPSINLLFWFLGDFLMSLPLLLRTLVLTGILVPWVFFFFLPFLTKIFAKWLSS